MSVSTPGPTTAGHGGRSAPSGGLVPVSVSVLACPAALCPHVEFALAAQVRAPVSLEWSAQQARPGMLTACVDGRLPQGSASAITARLRGLDPIWFEVVEGPVPAGERFSYTPELGVYRADLSANGDLMVSENRLRDLIARSSVGAGAGAGAAERIQEGIQRLLGQAWDDELEPLRVGTEGMEVSLLRRTG